MAMQTVGLSSAAGLVVGRTAPRPSHAARLARAQPCLPLKTSRGALLVSNAFGGGGWWCSWAAGGHHVSLQQGHMSRHAFCALCSVSRWCSCPAGPKKVLKREEEPDE